MAPKAQKGPIRKQAALIARQSRNRYICLLHDNWFAVHPGIWIVQNAANFQTVAGNG